MTGQTESALRPSHAPYMCFSRFALDACMASIVVAVGVAGLTAESWLRRLVEPWINIHLLFGALLCGWLAVRIAVQLKQPGGMRPGDFHEMSRQQSRIAYLTLYAVIGVKLCVSIARSVWSGGHIPLDEHFLSVSGGGPFDPKDDYQMCLTSGLIALILVRVMVLRLRARSVAAAGDEKIIARDPAAAKPAPSLALSSNGCAPARGRSRPARRLRWYAR
jgi:hypothetical protein